MRIPRFTGRTLAATAVAMAAVFVMAGPAGAIYDDGDPSDPGGDQPMEVPDRPDLRVSALSVSPVNASWSISYTVVNNGTASAASSTLKFSGGPGVSTQVSVPSLAIGASKSGSVSVPRADCYVLVTATADSARVVVELNETNNARTSITAVPGCPPRYKVTASHFKAVNESGADWTGSDEPYWLFSTVSNSGTASTRATRVFGDIDSGDTQQFPIDDSCLWGCSQVGTPAPNGIGLSVQLWEQDLGHVDETWHDTAQFFQDAGPILSSAGAPEWVSTASNVIGHGLEFILGWAEDDLLGSNTYAFTSSQLASALPNRGTSFTDTRTYTDGGATYTLTMTISRIV
jgi:hypothetical protein